MVISMTNCLLNVRAPEAPNGLSFEPRLERQHNTESGVDPLHLLES